MNRFFPLLLLMLMALMAGCNVFNNADTAVDNLETAVDTAADVPAGILGIDQPLTGQGVLVCNTACSDRAQCGYLNDTAPVILVNQAAPNVEGHDAFSPQGTIADILEMQAITLQNNSTGEQFQAPFYRIRTADIESGWVAGWCIQQ